VGGGGGEHTKERAEGCRRRGQTKALQVRSEKLWGNGGGERGVEKVRGVEEVWGG
jgi:hypothetical protein